MQGWDLTPGAWMAMLWAQKTAQRTPGKTVFAPENTWNAGKLPASSDLYRHRHRGRCGDDRSVCALSPNRPDSEKNSPYECGFEAFEDSRMKFDVRYYLVAILFIIFDLEIAFLPWAVVLDQIGAWSASGP